jgi:hypothetical protein
LPTGRRTIISITTSRKPRYICSLILPLRRLGHIQYRLYQRHSRCTLYQRPSTLYDQTNYSKTRKNHPLFQLIPQRITNKDKTATTRAYTVQCAKADARQLIHLLTHGDFRQNPVFIPFKYKLRNPRSLRSVSANRTKSITRLG